MVNGSDCRGQATAEFMIIFSFAILFFVVLSGILQMNSLEKNENKRDVFLQNIALNVRNEINLAQESSIGYSREFTVPDKAFGAEFNITLVENMVFVYYIDGSLQTFSYKIPDVIGDVKKGVNRIRKSNVDGLVYVN